METQTKPKKVQLGLRVSPLTKRWLDEASAKEDRFKEDLLDEALMQYLSKLLGKKEPA